MNNKKRIIITVVVLIMLSFSVIGIFKINSNNDITHNYNVADDGGYYTARIHLNGADAVEKNSVSCKVIQNGCYVDLPNAWRNKGTVLGYSDNKDDTKAKYSLSSRVFISSNVDLYVISYNEHTLVIDDSKVDFVENKNVTCKAYNIATACMVTLPRYNKKGYENKGYSTSSESKTGFIYAGDIYQISKDIVVYPIYSTSSRKKVINVSRVLEYNGSFIEIENGCDKNVYNLLLGYLDDIKRHTPYMLLGNKITFLSDPTFDEVWGSKYVGMNYGPKMLRSVDIRCSNTVYNDYYATMVHEMAHSWDFYYAKRLGANISSQSDIINLYNKYKNQGNIFREYSFSNLYEFVADMMRYYYFKEYVPRAPYKNLLYPTDIKTSLERYICISVNDYVEGKCK